MPGDSPSPVHPHRSPRHRPRSPAALLRAQTPERWSFRDLERELCSNLVYRRFTHYDAEATPDFTSFSRLFALLGPSLTQKIHQRVVEVACESGVAQGRKLKTDTTCDVATLCYTSLCL